MEPGKKRWWLKRIVGKKEQEVLVPALPSADSAVSDVVKSQDSKDAADPPTRRVSPREHPSTRSVESWATVTKRGRPRMEKVVKILYLVEWELSDTEVDTSWEPQESLVKQGLQEFIDDYEARQLDASGQVELGLMSVVR